LSSLPQEELAATERVAADLRAMVAHAEEQCRRMEGGAVDA